MLKPDQFTPPAVLAQSIGVSKPVISQALDALLTAGLIRRKGGEAKDRYEVALAPRNGVLIK